MERIRGVIAELKEIKKKSLQEIVNLERLLRKMPEGELDVVRSRLKWYTMRCQNVLTLQI